jgi:hypothetical protein
MSPPIRIFDGEVLRAEMFFPAGKRLFVSFRQRVQSDGAFDVPRPARTFVDAGFAQLHIQSRFNDWYINTETTALEVALAKATGEYGRRVAMGFSMGGYGALRFSGALDLRHVILVAPQFSIHPDVVPWDRRFHRSASRFDPALGDLARFGRRQLAGAILADPFRPADIANARLIQEVFGRIALARVGGAGHQASKVLREGGGFGALQRALRDAPIDLARVLDLHRSARRGSAAYWAELAAMADRHGHMALARNARARIADLQRANDL